MTKTNRQGWQKSEKIMKNEIKYSQGNHCLNGATVVGNLVNFTIDIAEYIEKERVYLQLYKKGTKVVAYSIELKPELMVGGVASICIQIKPGRYDYGYTTESGISIMDPYAKIVNKNAEFGKREDNVTYGIMELAFPKNTNGFIPYDEGIIYKLHVRGFTKHKTSKVRHRGTFSGLVEKLDYLKELGINIIELMPAYEFEENMDLARLGLAATDEDGRVNYWGYTGGYYFAPKAAYTYGKKPYEEFAQMVQAIHEKGMEVLMDFYFVGGTSPVYIVECLKYWVMTYGVDGFVVNSDVTPANIIAMEPMLAGIKLIAGNDGFGEKGKGIKRYGVANDSFLVAARRFLKSDEGSLYEFSTKLKENPYNYAAINYLSTNGTFTVMDTVSYDLKHNEANGENNKDGAMYNYSWNCGAEGATRKKKVLELRNKQIKNAFTMLLTAQGTPLIYAGDEMGHSCKGNNNPYCQDNDINYINYNKLETNNEIYDFVKTLLQYRKTHKILHMEEEPRMMDFAGIGCPDMSFHGTEPWRMDTNHVLRHFAMMLCPKAAANQKESKEGNIFIAYNMHWEEQSFGIPMVAKKSTWRVVLTTDNSVDNQELIDMSKRCVTVPPRTIVILEQVI